MDAGKWLSLSVMQQAASSTSQYCQSCLLLSQAQIKKNMSIWFADNVVKA